MKLTKEKYVTLCEKEELVNFLCEKYPYAPVPKRINTGLLKGCYKTVIRREAGEKVPTFTKAMNSLAKEWRFGDAKLSLAGDAEIIFSFDDKKKREYENEFKGTT